MIDHDNEEIAVDPDEEEYLEMIQAWDDDEEDDEMDNIPSIYFTRTKPMPLPDDHPRHNYRIDDQGHIVVKNPSAWWIPKMKIMEEIDGTIYTVTGSYEGTELLDQKLTRIMLHNLEEN